MINPGLDTEKLLVRPETRLDPINLGCSNEEPIVTKLLGPIELGGET